MGARTVTFRPAIDTEALKKIAKQTHYGDLTEFINDAIKDKVAKEAMDPKVRRFISQVSHAAFEYMGWKFSKPSAKEAAEIRRRVAEMKTGKVKTVTSQELLRRLRK